MRNTHSDGEDGGHAVQVIWVIAHLQDFWDNRRPRPLHSKHIRELLQIDSRGFSDRKDRVAEPGHAQRAELVVEELNTKLSSQQRNVLDDGLSDTPLFVLGKLNDGR